MADREASRKKGRDEPVIKNKARRTTAPEEEEALIRREADENELARRADELFRRQRRGATAEDEDDSASSDQSWEDIVDEAEEEIIDAADEEADEDDDEGNDDEEYAAMQREAAASDTVADAMKRVSFADDEDPEGGDAERDAEPDAMVWRGDQEGNALEADQKLVFSNKAYDSFFQLRTEYPCLSFDIIADDDGSNRTKYPLSMYLVCGSQADERNKNQLYILKLSNIGRTKHDAESDEDSDEDVIGDAGDSDEDEEGEEVNNGEPMVDFRAIKHHGTANRVRCSQHQKRLCAVWSDVGHVQVFSLQNDYAALADFANWSAEQAKQWNNKNQKDQALKFCTPSSTHKTEGYGLDWSTVAPEMFASGDCAGDMYIWKPTEDGKWTSSASSAGGTGNRSSIEEIKWSPIQRDVLMCGRAGGMVEVWDTRDMRKSQIAWRADEQDINVCDWNRAKQASHLFVTGADSGIVAVWDLRRVKTTDGSGPQPIQSLLWHKKRITSVEFSLLNESVLAVTGDDAQCTLWDLSLERDPSEEKEVVGELFERKDLVQLPDQLMFQHQGLEHPKELHWHNQIPGMVVTTDFNGLHLFKPMNWKSLMK